MSEAFRIWRGGADDAAALAALHAPVFADAWPEEAFRSLLPREGVIVLMGSRAAVSDAEGFILIRVVAGEAEVLTFCVAAQARRSGLGSRLLATAYDLACELGAKEMFLEVGEKNDAALALYLRDGFVAVGRRAAYYHHGDQSADALVMRRVLNQR
jgi:[ribosomal protein S18]-alanine N-acetyltransferase